MVKYLAVMIAVVAALSIADSAQARGRRGGCSGGSCYGSGGGCPGGVCYAAGAPTKYAAVDANKATVAVQTAPAPRVVATQSSPRYANSGRRWFGRR